MILRAYEIPPHILDLIKMLEIYIRSMGESGIAFTIDSGVRQVCVISAVIFNLVIEWVTKKLTEGPTPWIRWTHFSVDFVGDVSYAIGFTGEEEILQVTSANIRTKDTQ